MLPIGWLYATYHHLQEPETSVDMVFTIFFRILEPSPGPFAINKFGSATDFGTRHKLRIGCIECELMRQIAIKTFLAVAGDGTFIFQACFCCDWILKHFCEGILIGSTSGGSGLLSSLPLSVYLPSPNTWLKIRGLIVIKLLYS